jgi:hypothetical protein
LLKFGLTEISRPEIVWNFLNVDLIFLIVFSE